MLIKCALDKACGLDHGAVHPTDCIEQMKPSRTNSFPQELVIVIVKPKTKKKNKNKNVVVLRFLFGFLRVLYSKGLMLAVIT